MASKASPFSKKDIQEAIKTQGEIIRQLKLEEQTDEVKKKVKLTLFFFSNQFLFKVLWLRERAVNLCHVSARGVNAGEN